MKKQSRVIAILNILKHELPHCFRRGSNKLPLAIGIHRLLFHYYEGDPRFSKTELRKALLFYTSSDKYLKKLVFNAPRIALNGQIKSYVTREEAFYAHDILKEREFYRKNLKAIKKLFSNQKIKFLPSLPHTHKISSKKQPKPLYFPVCSS